MFSLVNGLPSTPSAHWLSQLLFGRFTRYYAAVRPLRDVRVSPYGLSPSPTGLLLELAAGVSEVSRFSCMKFPAVLGSTTTQGQ